MGERHSHLANGKHTVGKQMQIRIKALLIILLTWTLTASAFVITPFAAGRDPELSPKLLEQFTTFSAFPSAVSWGKTVPQAKTIHIKSSADGSNQPALYYDSGTSRRKPLLVVLHSWSDNYRQKFSIPYGVWSVVNDWVFIHPDYRGVFNNPKAAGSELAVNDILDAVEYAIKNANVDPARVYLVGFSGGAMAALIMAGRYPELWTGVAAWVPVYSMTDWYSYVTKFPERHYAGHIVSACGGAPRAGTAAAKECDRRSPGTYLKNARGKRLQIYIGHGIHDDFAQPGNALRAFNDLADSEDRISEKDIATIDQKGQMPAHLAGTFTDRLYENARKPLLFRRTSGNATVSLFKGGHDVIYNAGLLWLSEQRDAERNSFQGLLPVREASAGSGTKD